MFHFQLENSMNIQAKTKSDKEGDSRKLSVKFVKMAEVESDFSTEFLKE